MLFEPLHTNGIFLLHHRLLVLAMENAFFRHSTQARQTRAPLLLHQLLFLHLLRRTVLEKRRASH